MYVSNDTIAALSSGGGRDAVRTIVRISGPQALNIAGQLIIGHVPLAAGVRQADVRIDDELACPAAMYVFRGPHSYTGDDLVELHVYAGRPAVEKIMESILASGARPAGPGEFTARAYLNGKMDLTQAEAVAQIVSSGNALQLGAAQRLFAGRLTTRLDEVRRELLDVISRIEAGLDFSGEDIEFISTADAKEKIASLVATLGELLRHHVNAEEIMTLPAVGIAGASNAGKSSLANALLARQRSIVSAEYATTRDVITDVLALEHCNCALFDCAGLTTEPHGILDELAQSRAMEAIGSARLVLFCVDSTKGDWEEDAAIFNMPGMQHGILIGTKCDSIKADAIATAAARLKERFGREPLMTSTFDGTGLDELRARIDSQLGGLPASMPDVVSLNQRHRQCIEEAIGYLGDVAGQITSDNQEVIAMLLHNAYRTFGELWEQHIDDVVLERIFSQFCIGK